MTIDMTIERQMELMRDEANQRVEEEKKRAEEEKKRADKAEKELAELKRKFGITDDNS